MSNTIIVASTKEEKEQLLNLRIEKIKRQNEKLLNKHKLIEEDKRLAELQGRTITPPKHGDNFNVERKPNSNCCMNKNEEINYTRPRGQNMPPMEPINNFLFDKMRDGPEQKEDRRAQTRRHPRNYGGVNFEDVPKKIQQEKAKQNNSWKGQIKVDCIMAMTGKERRELDEWRKEREEIDKKRLQRQKKEDGGWKREWDQNKDGLFGENEQSPRSNSSPREQSVFNNRGNSQGHYNRVYHQMRRSRGSSSEHHQDTLPLKHIDDNNNADSPRENVNNSEARNLLVPLTSSPHSDYSGNNRNFRNGNWKTGRGRSRSRNEFEKGKFSNDSTPSSIGKSPSKENSIGDGPVFDDSRQSSVSSSSSLRKSVRFVESPIIAENGNLLNDEKPAQMGKKDPRTGRNFVGSGRFSGSQKLRGRGRWNRREFNARSPEYHSNRHSLRFGYPIKKIYLEEAMYKPVEIIINSSRSNKAPVDEHVTETAASNKPPCVARPVSNESSASIDVAASIRSEFDDADKKSADGEKGYENDEVDDEDEQWEDIDEEVCLELDHGIVKEETNLDASSESFDEFIIKNTLRLELEEEVNNEGLHLMNHHEPLLCQQGGYPDILDWEDEVDSISHLSDLEKFPITDEMSEESKKEDEVDCSCLPCEEVVSSDVQRDLSAQDGISQSKENTCRNGIDAAESCIENCGDLSTCVNDINKGEECNDVGTDMMVHSKCSDVINIVVVKTSEEGECREVDACKPFQEIMASGDVQKTLSSGNRYEAGDQDASVFGEAEIVAEIKNEVLSAADSGDCNEREKKEDIVKRLLLSDENAHHDCHVLNEGVVDVIECP